MNLDYSDSNKVWQISIELNKQSIDYLNARKASAEAQRKFMLYIGSQMPILRNKKSNVGIETAQVMVLEPEHPEVVKELYTEWITQEAIYKGLEKVIDGLKTQLTLAMNLNKNHVQNT